MSQKNFLNRETLIIAVSALLTIMLWIALSVFLTATKSTITQPTAEQLVPLEPQLNLSALEKIKNLNGPTP